MRRSVQDSAVSNIATFGKFIHLIQGRMNRLPGEDSFPSSRTPSDDIPPRTGMQRRLTNSCVVRAKTIPYAGLLA